ncbi:hypothetical protein, partial [Streptomyces sp. RP5T]|uniref:hypothetical protein n=1 Tax=Streptomyces sp. RP5T TaxID=2490848 RepID=UPI0021AE04BE
MPAARARGRVSARAASAAAEDPSRARDGGGTSPRPPADGTHHAYGSASWGASGGPEGTRAQGHGPSEPSAVVPGQGGAPRIEHRGATGAGASGGDTHGGRSGVGSFEVTRTTAVPPPPPADHD